jgi:integrase
LAGVSAYWLVEEEHMRRREYGSLRHLPSGRWQARYPGSDGRLRPAPQTFPSRQAAAGWLASLQTDLARGAWVDPSRGEEPLADYATAWLAQRVDLRPRTHELYAGLLERHLLPHLGSTPLAALSPAVVRRWHAERLRAGLGQSRVAKAYRLLKAILNTAVADEVLLRNPCVLRGVAAERTPERIPPTVEQAYAVADALDEHWRMLVVLAVWSGLRWGELTPLRRRSVDLTTGQVSVSEQFVQTSGRVSLGPPKSDAGRRVVHLPPHVLPELGEHLDRWVGPGPDAWLFTGTKGAPLTRTNFTHHWARARTAAGVPSVRFHDLRHLSATLAATAGATTRELMSRMGHSSPRAALIYQHALADRDRQVAEALSTLHSASTRRPEPSRHGRQQRPDHPDQLTLEIE